MLKKANKFIACSPQFFNNLQGNEKQDSKRINPRRGLLSESQLQFRFKPNFVVNDSSDSDSNSEQKDKCQNKIEENKVEVSKLEDNDNLAEKNKRPKLELKQSNSEAKNNTNSNLLGVPPAVKAPMNRK